MKNAAIFDAREAVQGCFFSFFFFFFFAFSVLLNARKNLPREFDVFASVWCVWHAMRATPAQDARQREAPQNDVRSAAEWSIGP